MTTTPDSNVRVGRRPGAANARRARRSPLARLLLTNGVKLLLSFAAASSMSACIIPIGPEFQDPPGAPNAPPQILDPDPTWGAEVAATTAALKTFQFNVTDANAADVLYIKWIVEGFAVRSDTSMLTPDNRGMRLTKLVTCNDIINKALSRHPVMAVVADRKFIEGDPDLMRVEDQGIATPITWTLNLTCPVSP
jgi:hypothetical protein